MWFWMLGISYRNNCIHFMHNNICIMRKCGNVSWLPMVVNYVIWKYEIYIGSWCIMKILVVWKSFYLDVHVNGIQTTFSQIKEFSLHTTFCLNNYYCKIQRAENQEVYLFTFKFHYGGLIWILINRAFFLGLLRFYISVSICLCVLFFLLTRAYLIACTHNNDRTNFIHLNYLCYKFQSPKAKGE